MKKIISILSAAFVALAAVSCIQEELATYDASKASAPVLLSYTVTDDEVSVDFTPGTFGQSFNQNMPVNHSILLKSVNGSAVETVVPSTVKEDKITITVANLSKTLIGMGYEEGSTVALEMAIRASMQEVARDNRRNGYTESAETISIPAYEVYLPTGDPYGRYTEKSPWSLIGSFNSWSDDYEMWTNGSLHVAKGVELEAGAEVKFRKDADWAVNYGYADGVSSYTLGEDFALGQDGANIVIADAGKYDFILDADGATARIITSVAQQEDPYAAYTETSPWSLIGSFNSWAGDVAMVTNGTLHVAKNVSFTAGTEFKFRKDADWAVNYGYADGVSAYTLGEEFAVGQDGANIVIAEDGEYDIFLDPENATAKIILTQAVTIDPYAAYTEVSPWSVIGSFNSWAGDVAMVTNGTLHVAKKISFTAGTEWKFRKDASWTVNYGYADGVSTYELGEEFALGQDGANIIVLEDGEYDLILDPEAATAKVIASIAIDGGTDPGVEPGPTPVTVTGWNIIGLNGDWENDILATQDGNVWTAYITAPEATEFKWRKDGGWDENYGGVLVALGEPFAAVAGGDNIQIPAGFWKVQLDTEALTITVSNGEVWSLIGDFNSWGDDVDMALADGKWVSPVTKLSGGFKIRHNHSWDENFGGTLVAIGEPFTAVAGGDNISVEEGNYVVTYDPEAGTILVDELGWGLVGTINGWGGTPDIMLKEDGLFLVARNVALTADDEIKLRYNQDWGVNRGGDSKVGAVVKAVPDGANIKPGVAGNYDVYYRPDSEVIIVNEAGADLVYWGVVGTINGWSAPDYIMWENADGNLVYENLAITASDEIKIRMNEDWAVNRGGNFVAMGEPFAVEADGPNIKVGDGNIVITYNPAAETITITGEADIPDPVDPGAYNEYIYAIGSDTGWSGVYYLSSGKDGDAFNGKYKGFGYLSGEFKFKPNEDDWSGDWEYDGEGKIADNGGSNCPAPETAGYYMIEVDLTAMTYSLTLINGIGLIGPAQAGGWDTDTDLAYDAESGLWKGTVELAADEYKFRANDDWAINWGGALDALTQGGGNLKIEEAGTYAIELAALCDGKAHATVTKQ